MITDEYFPCIHGDASLHLLGIKSLKSSRRASHYLRQRPAPSRENRASDHDMQLVHARDISDNLHRFNSRMHRYKDSTNVVTRRLEVGTLPGFSFTMHTTVASPQLTCFLQAPCR